MRIRSLLISIDFDCFRVLFVVRFSKLNCLFILQTAVNSMHKRVIFYYICHTFIFNNIHFNY
jgi:hypothetical protein